MSEHQSKNDDEFRPQVGDYDDDYAVLEDGFSCSIFHCLEKP